MALSVAFAVAFSTGCVSHFKELRPDEVTTLQSHAEQTWSRVSSPCGVAVVVHGLNTAPDKMQGIVHALNQRNVETLNVALSGHHGDFETFKNITREQWLADVYHAYQEARSEADRLQAPLYFVGFSLGGALYADLMSVFDAGTLRYDKALLFSPAFSTRWFTRLVLGFGVLGSRHVIKSRSPVDYRAYFDMPVAGFQALFQSKAAVLEHRFRHLNIPTLIVVDPSDELISHRSLQNTIDRRGLSGWHVELIDTSLSTYRPKYHHLILDEETVGALEWKRLWSEIDRFMGCPATSQRSAP